MTSPSSENASSARLWLSLMFQSSLVPQNPLPDLFLNQVLPSDEVLWPRSLRSSYMANRNSLSLMIGPEPQTLVFRNELLSRLP
ncbi:hypothetical protein D3C73_853290 [compost metagenome]